MKYLLVLLLFSVGCSLGVGGKSATALTNECVSFCGSAAREGVRSSTVIMTETVCSCKDGTTVTLD